MSLESFSRIHWTAEVRRIARKRFGVEYWPAIEAALLNCLESHSAVIKTPNKDNELAAFVLVCPPYCGSQSAYGIETLVPLHSLEIAFVATDDGWEGRGFARTLLEAVLFRCITAQQPVWLHVDFINEKAHDFYGRLGFVDILALQDPYGSPGWIMLFAPLRIPRGYSQTLQRSTLFDTPPCESEKPLRRGILAPPTMACY